MPLNAGVLAPLDVILPEGSLLKPSAYAAVSSGNTETSQRICDVIFRAFEAMAGSQGCAFLTRTVLPAIAALTASLWLA